MMLSVDNVWAGYGGSQILREMSFDVSSGEIVTIFGRNGSGRSTALKAIAGGHYAEARINPARWSRARWPAPGSRSRRRASPTFPRIVRYLRSLTVEENLRLGESRRKGFWSTERVWKLFPRLLERKSVNAGFLSGGEQQMLTICRSLVGNPNAILIDEPTEGLAPKVVAQVMDLISIIRREGAAVVLVEQKTSFASSISDRAYVVGHGHMVFVGSPADLQRDEQVRRTWLEV